MGEYIKAAEETKLRRYTSYACICVFMRLDKALLDSVSLSHDDYEWIQPLDYEHVPFRCRKCHAHEHLFRDCPLNFKANASDPSELLAQDGFTKVPSRKRAYKIPATRKKPQQDIASIPSMSNSFEILAQASEEQPLNTKHSSIPISSSAFPPPPGSSPTSLFLKDDNAIPKESQKGLDGKINDMEVDGTPNQPLSLEASTAENSQMQQMDEDPENIDMEALDVHELELACKKKDYDKIPELQLIKLEVVLSKAYQQKQLGIQPSSYWDGGLPPKDFKKRGRRTDLQRTIEVGKILVDSGRYEKLTKYYKPSINSEL